MTAPNRLQARPMPLSLVEPEPARVDWWGEAVRLVQAVLSAICALATLYAGLMVLEGWRP